MGELSKSLMLLSTPFPLLKPPPSRLLTVGCRVSTISLSIVVFPCSIRLHSAHFRPVRFASPLRSLGAQSGESLRKWPEWLKMVEYVAGLKGDEDPFDVFEEIPEDFSATARACLLFARERPDLLRSLPKKDIEILVENSSPFLFKNSQNSVRRMKAFIQSNEENALGSEPAFTVDLMKYLLTCVYEHYHGSGGVVEKNRINLVESSARSLLHELTKIDKSRSLGLRRQWTGREWECPQCEFFNHSKNASCLRCDLRRPENENPGNKISSIRNGEELKEIAESEISLKLDRILGRLSSPTAKPTSTTIASGAAGAGSLEEDIDGFPEIMPMRKGENRFVVSKKKDRSLTSPQYKRRAAMDQAASTNFVPFVPFPPGYFAKEDKNDGDDDGGSGSGGGDGDDDDDHDDDVVVGGDDDDDRREASNIEEVHRQDMSEEAKAERWFKRVAQINDISELSNIPDEDFPEIMPMRKGVNRFVVSKRKTPLERRLTSPQNRRNLTQEKSNPGNPFSEEQQEL